jgi:1,4-alpha-glucan branching enzyme
LSKGKVIPEVSLLTADDLYLFNEGSHYRLYEKLGSHLMKVGDVEGCYFAVWAPNAESVAVIGDWNSWDPRADVLRPKGESGIWEGFVPGVAPGAVYKYHLVARGGAYRVDKADPYAVRQETPPRTGSVVWYLDYEWHDQDWMAGQAARNNPSAPWSVYEVHTGSWVRNGAAPNYRDLAHRLADYVAELGFTHVELLPIMEHPFYGSWGYQTTGYFAPSSRQGSPQDFKYLVDHLHRNGIGVILDWVPSHFPSDEHALSYFDGTHLYEHADPRLGFHPDWNSLIFNYGRHEVRSFLGSSALYWLNEYHVDGLRVDAVASMLYLDYSRKAGEWVPNAFGGRENLEAINLLRRLNTQVYAEHPNTATIAEESTAWPMVSRPTYVGGLGFGMKWDMGWMHDTLKYLSYETIHRKFHHELLTFRPMYAFSENFVLPISHDEVVYGKGSLIQKMPGDEWQRFANLRLLFAYMFATPGKKLLFMGCEFGQRREWNHETGLEWNLLDVPLHAGAGRFVQDLNRAYREEPALHELDFSPEGFAWVDANDSEQSVVSFIRRGRDERAQVLAVFNFTPVVRHDYRVGVPAGGFWQEIVNSDADLYGGSGQGNLGGAEAVTQAWHGQPNMLTITLPPLGAVFFRKPTA